MYSNYIFASFLLIIVIQLTYELESGSFEVRDLSLTRPYQSGRLNKILHIRFELIFFSSFFYNEFSLASNW